jgi:hypothetical protein
VLVAVDLADRHELICEAACLLRGRPAPMALEREGVLVLPRDSVALGDVLARLAHRLEREQLLHSWVGEAPAEGRVPGRAVAIFGLRRDEWRARHRLDPTGNEELAVPGADRVRSAHNRREPGRAKAVDGDTGDRLWEAGEERGHARDVAVVLARLIGSAEVDVLDLCGVDACALDRLLDDERR